MQRESIAGTLPQHPIGYGEGLLPDPHRLFVAAQSHEPIHAPTAGLGVIGADLQIAEILAAELGGDLHGLLLGAPRSFEVVGLLVLETGTRQRLQINAASRE